MFTLPSMWNLIISTIVFFIAAGYLRRYLEDQGLPKGMTRGTLVFALASLMSWGSGEMVDWGQEKIEALRKPIHNVNAKHKESLSKLYSSHIKIRHLSTPDNLKIIGQ